MKISLNWLAEYVELPASVDELAAKLTHAGLEIEGIERLGEDLGGVVVAQIIESKPHPDAEKLSVTRVDAGSLGVLQVVCGAKNYKVGDKVPLATVGTTLPGNKKIGQAKLRGVESFGMLCSTVELGLPQDVDGLLILDPSARPGTPIAEQLGLKDTVFTVNVTPNRSDCLSHLGIAREVAALTGKKVKLPEAGVIETGPAAEGRIKIRVEAPERCPHYAARIVDGIKLGPSPQWMQARLRSVGVRAISNAVDITNYVLMELGQPLHAFDLDLVEGAEIVVRLAKEGEKMSTLDAKERTLSADDLVIGDAKRPSALAGVMGGATSEVSAKTTRILLESAYFQPSGVRRTSRRHGLHTESSHRFERGVDPGAVRFAQDRAARLFAELCGGTVAEGRVESSKGPVTKRVVPLRFERVGEILGAPVSKETTTRILESLGFHVVADPSSGGARVEVPTWRGDVEREVDFVEEVARIQGFASIPASMPRGAASIPSESKDKVVEDRSRLALSGSGYSEVVNYSFVGEKELLAVSPAPKPIALRNPLSAEQSVMRTTLLLGLLQNLGHSLRRQVQDVRLYELGRAYLPQTQEGASQPALEPRLLSGVLFGGRNRMQWGVARQPVDFFDLKGAVEQLLASLGIVGGSYAATADVGPLHPRSACLVSVDGKPLGRLGELHPRVAQALDLPREVFVFELSYDALVAAAQITPTFHGVPRFPAVLRDLAVTLDGAVAAAAVTDEIRSAGEGLVEEAILFDVYRGTNIPEGRKSLAFAIRYRAADRTLTDDEAVKVHERIVKRLAEKFRAELRA